MSWLSNLFSRKSAKLYTGRILSGAELRAALGSAGGLAVLGKDRYAEINSAAVIGLAQKTRDQLWAGGVNKWGNGTTCTLFAAKMVIVAGEQFYLDAFYERTGSPLTEGTLAPAVGDIWFHPDDPLATSDHAIAVCVTEKGALFIDSQAPDALRPTSKDELYATRQCRFL
jgi:hypothetical protein